MTGYRWFPERETTTTAATPSRLARSTFPSKAKLFPISWMEAGLELIQKYRINPLRAARVLSHLAAAMHDTVAACTKKYGPTSTHAAIAASFAAGPVLEYFFPEETKGRWVGESILIGSSYPLANESDWIELWKLSQGVAQQAIARALTDGSARINALAQPPKDIALRWVATPPLWSTRPAEPGAPMWRPWLTPATIGNQCPAPLTLNPVEYEKAVAEVYETHQKLTPQQKKIADDWNLDVGTATPPGVWLLKIMCRKEFSGLTALEQTSVLSLLTATMLDAFTACWFVKFKWWTERPATAIRRLYDPNFLPHVVTPSFPSYTSGHATVSGAAATILSSFFPQFADEWMDAAQEAADSRLYGGIHFKFDNEEGLSLGKKVGQSAIAKLS